MTQPKRSWLTRPGGRVVEQAITQLDRLIAGRQSVSPKVSYLCCDLAKQYDPNCYTECANHGGGYYIQYWWCCQGAWRYQCQECTNGSDCDHGTFYCSGVGGQLLC